ncbi:MAG: hypothetical protein AAGG54_10760 [Pseudomonadota bacterium]
MLIDGLSLQWPPNSPIEKIDKKTWFSLIFAKPLAGTSSANETAQRIGDAMKPHVVFLIMSGLGMVLVVPVAALFS